MKMGCRAAVVAALGSLAVCACGGSAPEPKDASSEAAESKPSEAPKAADEESASAEPGEKKPAEGDDAAKSPAGDAEKKPEGGGGEPTFPEGASVDQAMAAVPKGTPRSNIDPDRLAEPLQKPSVYEPCKVGTQSFKVRVAVWAGHAVGVDVTTPNKKLAECIDKQTRAISWPDTVRSLNTVEFSF